VKVPTHTAADDWYSRRVAEPEPQGAASFLVEAEIGKIKLYLKTLFFHITLHYYKCSWKYWP
jgi:hypothetical protein